MAGTVVGVPLTRMTPGNAVALTKEIKATIQDVVDKYGAERVTSPVMAAAEQLHDAAQSLINFPVTPFADKREIDIIADRIIGTIYDICAGLVQSYSQSLISITAEQQARLAAARGLCMSLFPEGTTFLKGRWSDQFGTTEILLQRARLPENQAYISALHLQPEMDLLEKAHTLYGERMGFTQVKAEDGNDPLADWHEALEAYLGSVIFAHRRSSEMRQHLTAPYEKLIEKLRLAAQRRAPATDEATAAATAADAASTDASPVNPSSTAN